MFILDIIFTFFSAYYNSSEELVISRKVIAGSYLKSWFILDIVSVLPLSVVFRSSKLQLGKIAKLPRIFQLIKTTKFVRLLKVIKARKNISKQLVRLTGPSNLESERLFLLGFILMILCHNLSCLWYLVAKLQDFSE